MKCAFELETTVGSPLQPYDERDREAFVPRVLHCIIFGLLLVLLLLLLFFCCTSIRYLKRQKCIESSLAHFTHEHSHANSKHKNKPRIVNRSYAVA